MIFGTYMGAFWIVKFILFPLGMTTPFLSLLFIGLTLCVPFMGYYYAKLYRDRVCGGTIGFGQAWLFTVMMYLFASLLVSVAHYIYFHFIDQGFILNTCEAQLNLLAETAIPGMDGYISNYREALEIARGLNAIDITMQLISTNVMCCTFLAIPTALFVMRLKK